VYTVSGKKPKRFLYIFYEARMILIEFDMWFPYKFVTKSYKRFPPHLTNVFTLPRECSMLIVHACCQWVVKK